MNNIRGNVISGVIWTGIGTLGCGLIGFFVTIILARHLTPSDFGLVEILLSIVAVSEVLLDCGFSQALIREKNISQKDISSVFFLNTSFACFIYGIIYFLAPSLSSFYDADNDFILIVRVLALKIIFDALSICQVANCTRQMNFKLLSKVSVMSLLASGFLSFLFIYLNFGIWSIVIYNLGISVFKTFLIFINVKWFPSFSFDTMRVKQFFNFGVSLMGYKVIDRIVTSFESMSVGKVYSSSDLGIFSQARKFNSLVIEVLLGIIQKVTYPALSKVADNESLKTGYKEIIMVSMFFISPISIFMLVNPEQFMVVIFGEQWLASAPFLRVFCLFGLIYPPYVISTNIFLVKGKTKLMLELGIVKQAIRLITIIALFDYSILSFVIGITLASIVSAIIDMFCSGRLINYDIITLIKDNAKTLLISTASVLLSISILKLLNLYSISLISITCNFAFAALIYMLFSILFKNHSYFIVEQILRNLLSKKRNI